VEVLSIRTAGYKLHILEKMLHILETIFMTADAVAGAPVRKPKNRKCRHHDGDTSRYQEIQFQ